MYKLEYLPVAMNDMIEIVGYISNVLKNPVAADTLSAELVKAAERLREFPYSNPVYFPLRRLSREHRKLVIKNYIMFYWVDEEAKTVTITRVLYGKRDYSEALK